MRANATRPRRAQGSGSARRPSPATSSTGSRSSVKGIGVRLDQESPPARTQHGATSDQAVGVASDAHIAIDQQGCAPTALTRQPGSHAAPQHRRAARLGLGHGHRGDVDPEGRDPAYGEVGDQPTGAAADVQDRRLAAGEYSQVDLVRRGLPPRDVQEARSGEPSAVTRAAGQGLLVELQG